MLTPNEIAGKKFDKGMGGYKVDAVEAFLSQVADQCAKIQDERDDLEHKLNILAERLEEYRNEEDSLRQALLSAQKLGDSVIREARTKAELILRDATVKAERMVDAAQDQIKREQGTLEHLKKEVSGFKARLMALYKQHLQLINALPGVEELQQQKTAEIPQQQAEPERLPSQHVEQPTTEIPAMSAISSAVAANATEAASPMQGNAPFSVSIPKDEASNEPSIIEGYEIDEEAQEDENQTAPRKSESRFGPLKFGEGYELKRDEPAKKR